MAVLKSTLLLITGRELMELSRKGIVFLTIIFNTVSPFYKTPTASDLKAITDVVKFRRRLRLFSAAKEPYSFFQYFVDKKFFFLLPLTYVILY